MGSMIRLMVMAGICAVALWAGCEKDSSRAGESEDGTAIPAESGEADVDGALGSPDGGRSSGDDGSPRRDAALGGADSGGAGIFDARGSAPSRDARSSEEIDGDRSDGEVTDAVAGGHADGPFVPDAQAAPDAAAPRGAECDPRLRAAGCAPGAYCRQIPNRPEYEGHCEPGDGCGLAVGADCPDPARPYCHLRGGGTFCVAPGALREGDSCVDEGGEPQPCGEGLVCNYSVCVQACDVRAVDSPCPAGWRCADISEAVAAPAGLCSPPACDFYTGEGCEAGEKCYYSIRNDGQIVGSCRAMRGDDAMGEACDVFQEGGDSCDHGLVCIGPRGAQWFCRVLCDTGAYQAPCPGNMTCREALQTAYGTVRGIGICYTNR